MSVMIGLLNFDNAPLDIHLLESVANEARRDGSSEQSKQYCHSVGMIFQPFDSGHGTVNELQPHSHASGSVMMWDGRLDNREDLAASLVGEVSSFRSSPEQTSDIDVLHDVYQKERVNALSRIVGDWALSIWDKSERKLVLACDFSGIRHLYYYQLSNSLLWCTDLKALVTGSKKIFDLCPMYIAEYLEAMPASCLTPYQQIKAVPPGHWVEIKDHRVSTHRYWTWDTSKTVRYKSDADYEEHFRYLFRQSVSRRLRTTYPVMAELSGGLDSSSIVCMADDIIKKEGASASELHTLSVYHEEEPGCDERPYFSLIEQVRGRAGTHINAARYDTLTLNLPSFLPVPIYPQGVIEGESDYSEILNKHSARTLLSGIGGDEFLGGVATGVPELADLLHARDLKEFAVSLNRWSIASRSSRWQLLHASLRAAVPRSVQDSSRFTDNDSSLLTAAFARSARASETSSSTEWLSTPSLPSQRSFVGAWCGLLRQLAYQQAPMFGSYEKTYPYLDRDLLNYLVNIPRSQVIRAGERRSLMRRALATLVPREVLWRKSKATSARRYMKIFTAYASEIQEKFAEGRSPWMERGYINRDRFFFAFDKASNGIALYNQIVMRAIGLEAWRSAGGAYLRVPDLAS